MENGLHVPTGRARKAIVAAIIWQATELISTLSGLYTIWSLEGFGRLTTMPNYGLIDRINIVVGVLLLATGIVSVVTISRWILRVNGNAQRWSNEVTVTPRWNIIWFFVPFASFYQPFEGIRQTWQASLYPEDPASVGVPLFMRLWWGFFIAMGVIGNASFRLSLRAETPADLIAVCWIDIAALLVDVPTTVLLIMLIRRLTAIQRDAILTGKFAVVDE